MSGASFNSLLASPNEVEEPTDEICVRPTANFCQIFTSRSSFLCQSLSTLFCVVFNNPNCFSINRSSSQATHIKPIHPKINSPVAQCFRWCNSPHRDILNVIQRSLYTRQNIIDDDVSYEIELGDQCRCAQCAYTCFCGYSVFGYFFRTACHISQ